MSKTDKIKAVARAFGRLLLKKLGGRLAAAVRLNRAEGNPNVCHTHDYCDANMVMERAMRECGESGRTVAVWNAAWDMAKAAGFDEKRI